MSKKHYIFFEKMLQKYLTFSGQSGWGEKTLTKANSGGMMTANKAKGHDGKSNLLGSIQREGQLVEVAYVEGK